MKQRVYFFINEESAKQSHEMMSYFDYKSGSCTAEYKSCCDKVYDIVDKIEQERPSEADRAYRIAERYAKRMANYYNRENAIGCRYPSVMIAGASNFNVRKKQKQVESWDSNHRFYEETQKLLGKLTSILYGKDIIKADDADAIDKLRDKLLQLTKKQDMMKNVNAYYRKNKSVLGCPYLNEEEALKLDTYMTRNGLRKPYPSYALSNNNANIHRVNQRLETLESEKGNTTSEIEYKGFTVVEDTEDMRLRIIFDEKPSEEARDALKHNGFHWSPSNKAWQRQLTDNARRAFKQIASQLE